MCIMQFPAWFLAGKATFKEKVSEKVNFDPSLLPYNEKLIKWLSNQKKIGRRLILCTASDSSLAKSVASYLGLFDEVIASDGEINLAGKNKANVLLDRYGPQGFDYVGNSKADLHVWKFANKAIIVNASDKVVRDAETCVNIELIINDGQKNVVVLWVKALRLHQWMKNILLFVPILASHQLVSYDVLKSILFAFFSFCLCASSVYLANDLLDIESDRNHPRKSLRPFASGNLEVWKGMVVCLLLLIISFMISTIVNSAFTFFLGIYFVLTCLYSFKLKQIVLVDCLSLAILYTLRIVAGSAALALPISFWIIAFSVFLFLSLAFVKRFSELQVQLLHGNHQAIGRGYITDDAPIVQTFGVVSGFLSSLVLAFYLDSEKVLELYSSPEWIWGCIPVLVFWISWVWLQAHRGNMHDDPLVFAVKDKFSLISGALFGSFLIFGTFL